LYKLPYLIPSSRGKVSPKKKKETRKEKKDAKGFWTIMLTDWLKNFVPEFLTNQNLKPKLIVDYSPTSFFALGTVFRHFLVIYTYQDFE